MLPPITPPKPLLNPPLKGTDRSTAKGKVKDFREMYFCDFRDFRVTDPSPARVVEPRA